MLVCTGKSFCGRGKGFLAADESAGPWLRARHAEAAKIPDTGRVKTWKRRVISPGKMRIGWFLSLFF